MVRASTKNSILCWPILYMDRPSPSELTTCCLWPLIEHRKLTDRIRFNLLLFLFRLERGSGFGSLFLFPLFFLSWVDRMVHRLVLAPLVYFSRDGDGATGTRLLWVFPTVVWVRNGPGSWFFTIFPFVTLWRTSSGGWGVYLWPLVGVHRESDGTMVFSVAWPLFVVKYRTGYLKIFLLWPIGYFERTPGIFHARLLPLVWIYHSEAQAVQRGWVCGVGWYNSQHSKTLFAFPLLLFSWGEGFRRAVVLPLLYFLRDDRSTRVRFFSLPLVYRRTAGNETTLSLFGYLRVLRPKQGKDIILSLFFLRVGLRAGTQEAFMLTWLLWPLPVYFRLDSRALSIKGDALVLWRTEDREEELVTLSVIPLFSREWRRGRPIKTSVLSVLYRRTRDPEFHNLEAVDILWPLFRSEVTNHSKTIRCLPVYFRRNSPIADILLILPVYVSWKTLSYEGQPGREERERADMVVTSASSTPDSLHSAASPEFRPEFAPDQERAAEPPAKFRARPGSEAKAPSQPPPPLPPPQPAPAFPSPYPNSLFERGGDYGIYSRVVSTLTLFAPFYFSREVSGRSGGTLWGFSPFLVLPPIVVSKKTPTFEGFTVFPLYWSSTTAAGSHSTYLCGLGSSYRKTSGDSGWRFLLFYRDRYAELLKTATGLLLLWRHVSTPTTTKDRFLFLWWYVSTVTLWNLSIGWVTWYRHTRDPSTHIALGRIYLPQPPNPSSQVTMSERSVSMVNRLVANNPSLMEVPAIVDAMARVRAAGGGGGGGGGGGAAAVSQPQPPPSSPRSQSQPPPSSPRRAGGAAGSLSSGPSFLYRSGSGFAGVGTAIAASVASMRVSDVTIDHGPSLAYLMPFFFWSWASPIASGFQLPTRRYDSVFAVAWLFHPFISLVRFALAAEYPNRCAVTEVSSFPALLFTSGGSRNETSLSLLHLGWHDFALAGVHSVAARGLRAYVFPFIFFSRPSGASLLPGAPPVTKGMRFSLLYLVPAISVLRLDTTVSDPVFHLFPVLWCNASLHFGVLFLVYPVSLIYRWSDGQPGGEFHNHALPLYWHRHMRGSSRKLVILFYVIYFKGLERGGWEFRLFFRLFRIAYNGDGHLTSYELNPLFFHEDKPNRRRNVLLGGLFGIIENKVSQDKTTQIFWICEC